MKMTLEILKELGSCGDYTRAFKREFPIDQYPDGVDVNEAVCSKYDNQFPWSWAVDVMLNSEGNTAYNALYRELMVEYREFATKRDEDIGRWRERTGLHYTSDATGEQREDYQRIVDEFNAKLAAAGIRTAYDVDTNAQARAFGRIFDQHPEFRAPRVASAEEHAIAKMEQRVIEQHDAAKRDLEYVNTQLKHFTERLPVVTKLVEDTAKLVAPALARQADAHAKLLAERAATAQQLADEAATKAKELAEAAEATQTKTGDATASEVGASENVETSATS